MKLALPRLILLRANYAASLVKVPGPIQMAPESSSNLADFQKTPKLVIFLNGNDYEKITATDIKIHVKM